MGCACRALVSEAVVQPMQLHPFMFSKALSGERHAFETNDCDITSCQVL